MKKEIQTYITEVLNLLSVAFPTEKSRHHLAIGDDGLGLLWLWVAIGDTWHSIIFDENYDNVTPKEVVKSVVKLLRTPNQ